MSIEETSNTESQIVPNGQEGSEEPLPVVKVKRRSTARPKAPVEDETNSAAGDLNEADASAGAENPVFEVPEASDASLTPSSSLDAASLSDVSSEAENSGQESASLEPDLANSESAAIADVQESPIAEEPDLVQLPESFSSAEPVAAELADAAGTQLQVIPDEKKSRKGLFGRLKRSSAAAAQDQPTAEQAVPALTKEELEKSIAELDARAAKAALNLEKSQAQLAQLDQDMGSVQLEAQRIGSWVSGVSRSYIWNVHERMNTHLASVAADIEAYTLAASKVDIPEPGTLIALRKHFHSKLARVFFTILPIALFVLFLPSMMKWKLPNWLQQLNNPTVSTAVSIFIIVVFVGAVRVIRKYGGFKKIPKRVVFWWYFWLIVAAIVILLWPHISFWINHSLVPFLQRNVWNILAYLAGLFLVIVFGLLVGYYRNWSQFRQSVRQQIVALRGVAEGYVKTRHEQDRLQKMYEQTSEWMSILAHALYRPWKINPSWYDNGGYEANVDSFPLALRIASANEDQDSRRLELERRIGGRLLVQGWRSKAFDDLVKGIGNELGLAPGKFEVQLLDSDLPHESNNSRSIVARYLLASAESSKRGELALAVPTVDPETGILPATDRYLVEVARQRLSALIEETQKSALAEARPRVVPLVKDELGDIVSDFAGIDDEDDSYAWDEYLYETLGLGDTPEVPLSPLGFTDQGTLKAVHEHPRSYILVPARLQEKVASMGNERITVVPLPDEGSHSVELIARIDLVGPVDFDDLTIFGEPQKQVASIPVSVLEPDEDEQI